MGRSISISVLAADATAFQADVLVLKHAQSLYGLDRVVVDLLNSNGSSVQLPEIGRVVTIETKGAVSAQNVMFVGVKPIWEIGYQEIRDFARTALASLVHEKPTVRHVAFTLHGANFGLDEIEAFSSEVAGIIDAVTAEAFPSSLESITFVEVDRGRAERMLKALAGLLPTGTIRVDRQGLISKLSETTQHTLKTVGYSSAAKPHVFVAMPFAPEMDDIFHYGIQGAVNGAGLLCERADLSAFTGDVVGWVMNRIASSKLVVADLSSSNPNVYLEVGFAWGCRIPTVLVANNANDLKFDVRGQRCILYRNIRHLEESLCRELQVLNHSDR